jgi:hypothetical protein
VDRTCGGLQVGSHRHVRQVNLTFSRASNAVASWTDFDKDHSVGRVLTEQDLRQALDLVCKDLPAAPQIDEKDIKSGMLVPVGDFHVPIVFFFRVGAEQGYTLDGRREEAASQDDL